MAECDPAASAQLTLDWITFRGFKSIAVIDKLELRPLNVLIGPNGSGKSNLLAVGQTALGDGLRMVARAGGGLHRSGAQLSGADGAFEQRNIVAQAQAFAPPGQLQPGSTWNFQCWYRDPAGPCSAGTNLTNAVEVLFRP